MTLNPQTLQIHLCMEVGDQACERSGLLPDWALALDFWALEMACLILPKSATIFLKPLGFAMRIRFLSSSSALSNTEKLTSLPSTHIPKSQVACLN
eukprot:CAMPEP_0184293938 /NCGR_PEP_ID=MMETSP1049-20130417/5250_1 /TAXON_ID=77928 /ORGANISM="Proteomonas sulcata, Strain CCMP704" /LENGTH=95 /DNA_ID=CAMNT_0026602059 /DNA_START=134 /DNA_END=418 /DNA_ORIENTATION=+